MKFKNFLKEDKSQQVKILADQYLQNLLKTLPAMAKMVNSMSKDRQLTHDELVKAAHVGYDYLCKQKNTDDWDQKIKDAGLLVIKNLK